MTAAKVAWKGASIWTLRALLSLPSEIAVDAAWITTSGTLARSVTSRAASADALDTNPATRSTFCWFTKSCVFATACCVVPSSAVRILTVRPPAAFLCCSQ